VAGTKYLIETEPLRKLVNNYIPDIPLASFKAYDFATSAKFSREIFLAHPTLPINSVSGYLLRPRSAAKTAAHKASG